MTRFEGADGTGVVKVVVDRSGMVTDVVVPRNWREKVEPRALGHALSTAANEALARRLAEDLEHVTPAVRERSGQVTPDRVSEIVGLLTVFERDIEIYRNELKSAASANAGARGATGKIEVTMSHGRVIDVTVDPDWAGSTRSTAIRAEARSAFRAAGQRLAECDPRAVAPPASIARLRELRLS